MDSNKGMDLKQTGSEKKCYFQMIQKFSMVEGGEGLVGVEADAQD